MSKPTAVQWYIEETFKLSVKFERQEISQDEYTLGYSNLLQQAKAMHEEEIKDAYKKGRFNGQTNWGYGNDITAEQYYNETFAETKN
jgi:hypothetical protein